MRSKQLKGALSAGAISLGVVAGAAQYADALTTVYDSAGFESPKFLSNTPLDGQDSGMWIESGGANAGTAVVENSAARNGTQAVQLTRTDTSDNGGDKRYWPNLAAPVTPSKSQSVIIVNWDMNVARNVTGAPTGPFFGIEAYDPNANIICAAGVDATTGEVLFADPVLGGGFNNTTNDVLVALGAWNHFSLAMDFNTGISDLYVNNKLLQVIPTFISAGVTRFSDADLSAIGSGAEPPLETGSAVFDNYSIINTSSVPEPVGTCEAGIAAAAGMLSTLRRRGRAAKPKRPV